MSESSKTKNTISWIFAILFLIIGVLNIFLVDPIPGILYIFFAVNFLPQADYHLKNSLGFSIPFYVKIIAAILVLWATLGVGDLMEIFEAKFL